MSALLIFDLDGTLLDTASDLAAALNAALRDGGYPERTRGEVIRFVGNGVKKLIERALPPGEADEKTVERVNAAFSLHYSRLYAATTKPYDGIALLLSELKEQGNTLAVLSNKPEKFTAELIESFFPGVFSEIRGGREDIPKKPDPTAELGIIRSLGFTPEKTVHIGDSDTDYMTAKNSGAGFVGVSWGYRSREEILSAGAGTVADTPEELLRDLKDIIAKIS